MSDELIPAAQYVRMSTEHQRYSLENQQSAISAYAVNRGFEIVKTYADSGKSGLTLKRRSALQSLLTDALRPTPPFSAILVLDVSRWGRFQDTDQAAHYEFICRQSGIEVHYCAEPFDNDGSMASTIIKHLKRVMAAEYSRELSVKVSRAKLQQAKLGFRQGGAITFGFRRVLAINGVTPHVVLEPGQIKAFQGDRVITMPGPSEELEIVRRIFKTYIKAGGSFSAIARDLNSEGVEAPGNMPWTSKAIAGVIRNELCIGNYIYYRRRKTLDGQLIPNAIDSWVRVRVGPEIVSRRLFRRANLLAADGGRHRFTDEQILDGLRRLLAQEGRITTALIDGANYLPTAYTIWFRFGSLKEAYGQIGYVRPTQRWIPSQQAYWTQDQILISVRRVFEKYGFVSARVLANEPAAPSRKTIYDRFGSLTHCYELAGCPHVRTKTSSTSNAAASRTPAYPWIAENRMYWSDERIIQAVRRVFDERGRVCAALLDGDPKAPCANTVILRFGSLNRCYELAGCPTTRRGGSRWNSRIGEQSLDAPAG